MDVMGDNRAYSVPSSGAATSFVFTFTPTLTSPPSGSGGGSPSGFYTLVITLNDPSSFVTTWGSFVWDGTPGGFTPNNGPTLILTSQDLTQSTIVVYFENFADCFGSYLQFDGTTQVDGVTPSYVAQLDAVQLWHNEAAGSGWVTTGNAQPPFLFDPTSGPPVTSIPLMYSAGMDAYLPSDEAAQLALTGIAIVQDGGTSATNPTLNPVSADPAAGWTIDFDPASDYTGYEYSLTVSVNGAPVIGSNTPFSIKDLNLP